MKIKGYINYGYRPPAPFIAVMVSIKELAMEAKIQFLIDTGASSTIILWRDIERLRINVTRLRMRDKEFSGLGGLTRAKPTSTTISFTSENEELVKEETEAYVVSSPCPSPKLKFLPSILGRDVINEYNLNYSPKNNKVYLEK